MKCKNCGAPLNETDAFCKNCGSLVGFDTTPLENNKPTSVAPNAVDFSAPLQTSHPASPSSLEQPKPVFVPNQKISEFDLLDDMPSLNARVAANAEVGANSFQEEKNESVVSREKFIDSEERAVMELNHLKEVNDKTVAPTREGEIAATPSNMGISQEVTSSPNKEMSSVAQVPEEEKEVEIDEVKKSKKGFYIIGVIALVLIVIGIFAVFQYLDHKKSESEVEKPNIGDVDRYRINFEGYRIEIPESYIYYVSGNKLYISDNQNTWYTAIQLADVTYETISAASEKVVAKYQKSGFKINNAEEKNISNRKYYAIELQAGIKYALAVYSKADSNRSFAFTAYNPTFTIDYAILENISSILDSAVYIGEPGTINLASTIDVLSPLR